MEDTKSHNNVSGDNGKGLQKKCFQVFPLLPSVEFLHLCCVLTNRGSVPLSKNQILPVTDGHGVIVSAHPGPYSVLDDGFRDIQMQIHQI